MKAGKGVLSRGIETSYASRYAGKDELLEPEQLGT